MQGGPLRENRGLNESPSEKEGKSADFRGRGWHVQGLNESPSEKEGKCDEVDGLGNPVQRLNESPSEKEGKFQQQLLQSKASEEPQ